MTSYIALLRAVNLPGHNSVSMADLRELLAAAGFDNPRSLLQSGNLLFRAPTRRPEALETLLEGACAKRLGVVTDFLVRTADEWQEVLSRNPFPKESKQDPGHLIVVFLKGAPGADRVRALRAAIKGREVLEGRGRELYVVYPDGVGRSKLTAALIESKLGVRGTARNWNTVRKLAAASA